jgi:hypothetical protein
MAQTYRDQWIECTATELRIRGYYFPWGTKRIEYGRIRSVRRVETGVFTGRGRIWGTGNLGYWASLDPKRPRKPAALILDLGGRVKPFLTPDDADAMAVCLQEHTGLAPVDLGAKGPLM